MSGWGLVSFIYDYRPLLKDANKVTQVGTLNHY